MNVQESETKPIVFSTDQTCRVNTIKEFVKVGRILLGLSNGQVMDVTFNNKNWLMFGVKKTINVADMTSTYVQALFKKFFPSWLTITRSVK